MSPGNDDRCPWPGTESSRNVQAEEANPERTRQVRHRTAGAPVLHAFGYSYVVTARTGRLSSQVLVTRCPFRCGAGHRFTGTPLFVVGKREAPCTGLPFLLHALPQTSAVAA